MYFEELVRTIEHSTRPRGPLFMTKVHEIRRLTAIASCTRWSMAFNIIFAFNLASTPFMANLAEPRPGGVEENCLPTWSSYAEYVDVTTNFFQQLYNNSTMGTNTVSLRDPATNSFRMRMTMALPFEIPADDVFDITIRMPAAPLFGDGIRTLLSTFLTSNQTHRDQTNPWRICQHNCMLTLTYSELCLWIEKTDSTQYTIWVATNIYETIASCWIKFGLRTLLAAYILYQLWTRYYRHCKILLSNLRHVGFSREYYTRYEVVVGDPAYAILSDPVVSLAMVADIFGGSGYVTLGLIHVTQFQDVWLYANGCLYMARYIWFSYLGLRILSSVVKWRRWEATFAPVGPALLAVTAYVYSGPIISVMGMTGHVVVLPNRQKASHLRVS
ncbi:hypothetical protein Ae201684_011746 [Aphanomyces euteiches]|uniref:Uncharacterized protein n=1 Tax=Aphanomyces euteiches TaxID=100861 RepID=A0A6G0WTT4_9STRA|nr:hypothetical protein Ae201684_011746 [Aphanomyces euteiches]